VIGAVMASVLASGRVPGAAGQVLRGTLNGLWLGVLSDRRLRELDERYYGADDSYTTAEWNERGLFAWERELVERHFPAIGRVVVTACGGGREVLGLLRAGYDAHGYEPHPRLSAYAERFLAERGFASRAHACARDRFPAAGRCDGVVVGWGAYALIAPRATRVAFLRDAAAALAPGAPLLLSVFARPVHGRELRLTARLARVEVGDTLAPNRVHVFTRDELAGEIAAAGLRCEAYHVIGDADPRTSYACAIARAV
jgi:hypothetical protein